MFRETGGLDIIGLWGIVNRLEKGQGNATTPLSCRAGEYGKDPVSARAHFMQIVNRFDNLHKARCHPSNDQTPCNLVDNIFLIFSLRKGKA